MILTKEDRHKQAEKWAKATGSRPGKREYINAYFAGYFDHAQTRSDPIEAHIIQQFEELERQLNTLLGLFSDYDFECKDVKTVEALWNLMCLKKSEINAELFKVSKERDTAHAAALAAAVRVCYGDGAGESPDTWDWHQRDYANAIQALTPADAQRLYDIRIKEARLDELVWAAGAELEPLDNAIIQKRIAELSAEIENLKSQEVNTKGESA